MTTSLEKHHLGQFPNDQLDLNGGFTFEGLLIAARRGSPPSRRSPLRSTMRCTRRESTSTSSSRSDPVRRQGPERQHQAAAVENLKRKPTVVMPVESAAAPLVFPMPGWNDKRRV